MSGVRELEHEPDPPEGLVRFLRRAMEEGARTAEALAPKQEFVVIGYRRRWWSWRKRAVLLRASWRAWGPQTVLWLSYDRRSLGSIVCDKRFRTYLPAAPGDVPGVPRKLLINAIAQLVIAGGHGKTITTGQVQTLTLAILARLWDEDDRHSVPTPADISSGDNSGPSTTSDGGA